VYCEPEGRLAHGVFLSDHGGGILMRRRDLATATWRQQYDSMTTDSTDPRSSEANPEADDAVVSALKTLLCAIPQQEPIPPPAAPTFCGLLKTTMR